MCMQYVCVTHVNMRQLVVEFGGGYGALCQAVMGAMGVSRCSAYMGAGGTNACRDSA